LQEGPLITSEMEARFPHYCCGEQPEPESKALR